MSLELLLVTAALHLCRACCMYTCLPKLCNLVSCVPETLRCLPQQVGWWTRMLLHADVKQPQPQLHPLAVHWSTVEARWQALALHCLQPMIRSLSLTTTTSILHIQLRATSTATPGKWANNSCCVSNNQLSESRPAA